jgi:outer membrane protein TolC
LPQADIDTAFALAQAAHNRKEAAAFDYQQVQAQRDVAQTSAKSRWNALMEIRVGFNQTNSKLADVYENLLNQQYGSVDVNFPIFEWGQGRADVRRALFEKERVEQMVDMQKRTFEQDVTFQVERFHLLGKQLALAAKSADIAERRYAVAKNRYIIGKIDITNMLLAQNEKDNAKSNYIQTMSDYWVAYYTLCQLTLYDIEQKRQLQDTDFK